jgi:dehydrogenase/reductase SDR family protein 7B
MKNKVVIVTGASSGIGKACAEVFGIAGAKVVITGRNAANLNAAYEELKNKSIELLQVVSDVSIEADCRRIVQETLAHFGRIDVLINNAGISMRALFEDMDVSVLKKVMDINFYGTVYTTKYALPEIIRNKGSIVGMSSVAGYRGLPGRTGYSASKFAMQGFLESLRTELLKKEVHVLVACPGFTASNIRNVALAANGSSQGESPKDESSLMGAGEVAGHIFRAVVERRRTIILTGQGKLTVLLNKFFPAFMDKMVYNHFKKEPDSPLK